MFRKKERAALGQRKPVFLKNVGYNFMGYGIPVLAAVAIIPYLIGRLGEERFGIVSMLWAVVSYFGLFDFGLGRVVTMLIAKRQQDQDGEELSESVSTAFGMIVLLSLVGGALLALLAPWLAFRLLHASEALRPEINALFLLMAAAVPLIIASTGFRAVLEGFQRFDLVNAIRVPFGILVFLGPALTAPFTSSLPYIGLTMLGGYLLTFALYAYLSRRHLRLSWRSFRLRSVPRLLRLGGWLTVSNVISPIMSYMDRLFIGMLASVSVVAYYVTPFEVTSKLLMVSGAVASALFPAFAAAAAAGTSGQAARLQRAGAALIYGLVFPLALALVTFAPEGLRLWINADFAAHGQTPMQLLAAGVLVNALAIVPFTYIQAAGRPDVTAKLHLLELALYAAVMVLLIREYGIVGAALAWLLRVCADYALLLRMQKRLAASAPAETTPEERGVPRWLWAYSALCLALPFWPLPLGWRIALFAAQLAVHGLIVLRHPAMKRSLAGLLASVRGNGTL
uniref:Uncharacterized protein n=1 Tax=Paenibacillus athensensis TaxID=1967502 RepID=A0A4Y8PVN7_9BACL